MVGYSRLKGEDEAGTLAALKALRNEFIDPAIASHGGRIVKLMGDGALVEFASVVDASQAEFGRLAEPLALRGQTDGSAAPVEQVHAQRHLDRNDLAADRRLGNIQ